MFLRNRFMPQLCSLVVFCVLFSWSAYSQQSDSSAQSQGQTTVEGTVVSSGRARFAVRSDDNQVHQFTFDQNANKPRALRVGTRVRVVSDEGDQQGSRHATNVTVLGQQGQGGSSANAAARKAAPVPPAVQNVENQIQHEARRWRLGVRAGVGLDPELIMFGVHSQMGPVFSRNVFFRPNADFEWGEITDMVALNLESVYRIPTTTGRGVWAPYVGAGPSLNFIHQSFQTQAGEGRNISFGNFDYETGLNILMGFQNRHGTFFEVKTSVYSQPAPVFRIILGRTF